MIRRALDVETRRGGASAEILRVFWWPSGANCTASLFESSGAVCLIPSLAWQRERRQAMRQAALKNSAFLPRLSASPRLGRGHGCDTVAP